MNIWGIIPARFHSTRFPGKLLHRVRNKPILSYVIERVKMASLLHNILVLTDHDDIYNLANQLDIQAMMTPSDIQSGSERISYVLPRLEEVDAIINIQGDEPLIDPELINNLAQELNHSPIVTAVTFNKNKEDYHDPNIVKAIFNSAHEASYFSRSPIPYYRDIEFQGFWQHIGIYGYQKSVLMNYPKLKESRLEQFEKLEQLRFVENGVPIRTLITEYKGIGIDVPEDIPKVEEYL